MAALYPDMDAPNLAERLFFNPRVHWAFTLIVISIEAFIRALLDMLPNPDGSVFARIVLIWTLFVCWWLFTALGVDFVMRGRQGYVWSRIQVVQAFGHWFVYVGLVLIVRFIWPYPMNLPGSVIFNCASAGLVVLGYVLVVIPAIRRSCRVGGCLYLALVFIVPGVAFIATMVSVVSLALVIDKLYPHSLGFM